jgi:DNA-binding transcriptional MerR regulator
MRRNDIVVLTDERREWTLDGLAVRTGLHPALIARFLEFGLIHPSARDGADLFFDLSTVVRLRVISRLRESLGINLAGISVVLDLLERVTTLQRENEALRHKL